MPIPHSSPTWIQANELRRRGDVDGLLHALLHSGDVELRREAAIALGKLGDQFAAPHMHPALEDQDPLVRWHTACALARLADFPILLTFLGDERPPFFPMMEIPRFDPWDWVRPLGKRAVAPVLREMEEPISYIFVQMGADLAIEHNDHALVPVLWALLDHEDYRIRAVAADKLGALPEEGTPEKLVPLLGDEVDVVSDRAADSLQAIGAAALPALDRAARGSDEAIRVRAAALSAEIRGSPSPPAPPPPPLQPAPAAPRSLPAVETRMCIVCGREFRTTDPDAVACPDCGGPPEAPAPAETKIQPASESPPQAACIRCGRPFTQQNAHDDMCPDCRAAQEPRLPQATVQHGGLPAGTQRLEPPEAAPFAAPAALWQAGQTVAEIYTIEKELGRGGMGVVHLAREGQQGRLVAIKSPLGTFVNDPAARRLFTAEATAWMDLGSHPNVVRAFDVREIDYRPRIFMEYCDGGSLSTLISQHPGGLPWQDAYDLLVQVCWAVAFAHDRGMVHRDLKPANILLLSDGTAKVTDFGLVHPFRTEVRPEALGRGLETVSEEVMLALTGLDIAGTPPYMAPEQWTGQGIGPAADLYALGLILFELCTGARAFDLATHPWSREMDIAPEAQPDFYRLLHCEHLPLSPADLRPDMPEGVSRLIESCLAKQPDDRPASALEIAAGLGRALQPLGVDLARRPQPGEIAIATESKRDQAWALARLGVGAILRGDLADAERTQRRALALFEEIGDSGGISSVTISLGNICLMRNEYDQAEEFFRKAIGRMKASGDLHGLAICTMNLGIRHDERGEYRQARSMFEEALGTMELLGDRDGMAKCCLNLGNAHGFLNEYDQAASMYRKALSLSEELNDREGMAICLLNLGAIHRMRAEFPQAIERFDQAIPIMQHIGDRSGLAKCYTGLGNAFLQTGRLAEAIEMYRQGLDVARAIEDRAREAGCLQGLGAIYLQQGDLDRAEEMFRQALDLSEAIGERADAAKSSLNLATLQCRRGDYRGGLALYQHGLAIFEEIGDRSMQAKCCLGIGGIHCQAGDFSQGMAMFERARSLAEAIGDGETLAQSCVHLARGYEVQHQPHKARALYQEGVQWMQRLGIPVPPQLLMKARGE